MREGGKRLSAMGGGSLEVQTEDFDRIGKNESEISAINQRMYRFRVV